MSSAPRSEQCGSLEIRKDFYFVRDESTSTKINEYLHLDVYLVLSIIESVCEQKGKQSAATASTIVSNSRRN